MHQAVGAVAGRVGERHGQREGRAFRAATFNVALSPGWECPDRRGQLVRCSSIGLPFTETMTSPDLTPAAAAGPPARTVPRDRAGAVRVRADRDAQIGVLHRPAGDEIVDDALHGVGRHGEPDTRVLAVRRNRLRRFAR